MMPQEKEVIWAELERGRREFLDSMNGLAEDAAGKAPGPGKWSALECVEHVTRAEEYLLSLFTSARRLETTVGSPEREARILALGLDRTKRIQSSEPGRPTGRFTTLAEALTGFAAAREQTMRAIDECGEDMRLKTAIHPIAGPVNCHELLLIMAVHPRRHAQQIAEIRAALGK